MVNIIQKIAAYLKKHQEIVVLLIIFGLALFFRLWKIGEIPPGVSVKELDTIKAINGLSFNNLWLGGNFYQGGYIYSGFLVFKIFGASILNLRILSAIIGSLTVLLSYVFISKWFSSKVAAFCGFLFAISYFHISVSRLILPEITLPLVILALFVVLTEAYRRKNVWLFGIGGFLAGLGLYTSPAFILMPLLFLASGIYFYIRNKKFITAYAQEITISFVSFLAAAMPFFVSFAYHPMDYLTHFGFDRSFTQIIINIGVIAKMIFSGTNPDFFINIGTEPLFDPFVYMTAFFGLALAIMTIERRKYFFVVLWGIIFFLYAALKRGTQISDLIGILPVIFTFSALILNYILDRWFATFPFNKKAQLAIIFALSVFFALGSLYNFDRYFTAYKSSLQVKNEFSATTSVPLK